MRVSFSYSAELKYAYLSSPETERRNVVYQTLPSKGIAAPMLSCLRRDVREFAMSKDAVSVQFLRQSFFVRLGGSWYGIVQGRAATSLRLAQLPQILQFDIGWFELGQTWVYVTRLEEVIRSPCDDCQLDRIGFRDK